MKSHFFINIVINCNEYNEEFNALIVVLSTESIIGNINTLMEKINQ
jgi:hypothetical protein